MARKYTVATAPKRVRLQWLKKAQRARRYYARCRAKLGIAKPSRARRSAYAPAALGQSDLWEAGPVEHVRSEPLRAPIYSTERLADVASNPGLIGQVRAGSRVSFIDRFGKRRTGRAVMPSSSGGWVLNMGGRYGTPEVVHDDSIVGVSGQRRRAQNPELLVVNNPYEGGRAMRRRRRRRNSWKGNRRGHRAAALKGWRKRRHRGGKRRGSRRRGRRRGRKSHSRRKGSWRAFFKKWRRKGLSAKAVGRKWRKGKR